MLKQSSSIEISDSLLLMDFRMFSMILGGWLDFLLTSSGMCPGLLYGKYLPLARLSVTSRKFTTFLLASIVIFRPCLAKMLHNSFLISSAYRGDALVTPRPSSLYKPKLHALPNLSFLLWRR